MPSEGERVPQQRLVRTQIPGPLSRTYGERRAAAVSGGVGATLPVFVARAGGGIVEDVDGNRLIDFGSGISTTNVGNSAPRVVEAVAGQLEAFTHTCFMVTPYLSYVELCERLNSLTPGDHEKRSLLMNSGSEAVENAVKIARVATGRAAVIAFDQGFHGRTLLGMTLTGRALPYKQGFGPFAPEVYRAPYSYPLRRRAGLAETLTMLESTVGASAIAAVVVEPIAGEGGVVVPEPGWLAGLASWCRANGIVFVVDEVQTGFGRTGRWFACEHEGVVPDIVATAKSLGGGLPVSAVTGRAELMDAAPVGALGGTFGGNPLSCAAALAVIETIEADGLLERARVLGAAMTTRVETMAKANPLIGEVRGRGAMVGIELVEDDGYTPAREATLRLAATCHAEGLLVLTAGTYGNVLRLLPPLVISDELVDEGLSILEGALATC